MLSYTLADNMTGKIDFFLCSLGTEGSEKDSTVNELQVCCNISVTLLILYYSVCLTALSMRVHFVVIFSVES